MTTTRSLIADARYEVIPLKNLEAQLEHIPAGASVSVTSSIQSLGRNLVGRNNVVIGLVPPNTVFEPRLQQVDMVPPRHQEAAELLRQARKP